MRKPRIAVVGLGSLGSRHAEIYSKLNNVNLVCVCDIDKHKACVIGKSFKKPWCTDYKELLSKHIDAVSIVTPTSNHYKIAKF
ncbi:MAG: Gfo/Idh/MocA family oxidoreductase, partial [Candidatus Omnitrophica bacterium]|nr:Gfo/Idh/MocA family oxidoreductase [Candidatus Omnitrophota bacterium]